MKSRDALEHFRIDIEYYRKKLGFSEYFPIREEIEYQAIKKI